MPVAEASASATQQGHYLAVVGHLTQILARLGVKHHRAARHVDRHVLAVLARAAVLRARLSVAGEDMAPVAKRQEGPHVGVAPEQYVASAAPVAPVGPTLGNVFRTVEMA